MHKENAGVGETRNDGLALAKGEWVVFIDSDDTVRLDYFEILLNEAHLSNADIVCRDCIQTDGGTVKNESQIGF